jgi:predicted DsbA family dithiol-disulfide isomerase
MAKTVASEVAHRLKIACREVDMATDDGLAEALAHDVCSTPTFALDDDVIVRGRLISKEKLEQEINERLEKWRRRTSCQNVET